MPEKFFNESHEEFLKNFLVKLLESLGGISKSLLKNLRGTPIKILQ